MYIVRVCGVGSLCLSVYGIGTSVYMCSEGEIVERYECMCVCVCEHTNSSPLASGILPGG